MKEKIEITIESVESLIEKVKGEIVKKAEGLNRFELILFDFCAYEEILFKDHSGYTRSEVKQSIIELSRERFNDQIKEVERVYSELYRLLSKGLVHSISFSIKTLEEKRQQLPKHTKRRLVELFKEVGADISGITSSEFYNNKNYLNDFQSTDIYWNDKIKAHSFIYATRNSLHNNRIMQISESEVFVPINAGIAATIKFTPSSNFIRENLTKPAQLYCMHFDTIYLYNTIECKAPKGLIILSTDWIVEINYHAAPILGDSMRTAQIATEKRRNEIEDEERREEDQRRSDELDDMWDDIYLERNR